MVRADKTRRSVFWLLLACLVSVPCFSLYLGYSLAQNATPVPRTLGHRALIVQNPKVLNQSLRWTHYLSADLEGGLGKGVRVQYFIFFIVCDEVQ